MRHASLQLLLLSAACLVGTGCNHFPGKPGPEPDVPRPEHVLDFKTLYATNCAACHGVAGVGGPAISLANPVYLGLVNENDLTMVITKGVPGKLMPAFGTSGGGLLTDEQVQVLVHGLESSWGKPGTLAGANPPSYHAPAGASTADGAKVFSTSCARCHGENGQGVATTAAGAMKGSIVDPTYLGLVSDQYLRSVVIAGLPDQGMPDWRDDTPGHALSNDEVTGVVAWLGSHRKTAVSNQTDAQQQVKPEETHPQGQKKTDAKQGPL